MAPDSQIGSPSDRSFDRRTDPLRDRRRLAWYFGALLLVYVGTIVAFWPDGGDTPDQTLFFFVMFAPTIGALLARSLGPGVIQWGRLSWWMIAGLIPAVAVLCVYVLGSTVGLDVEDPDILHDALTTTGFAVLVASFLALGEEIGWRGFLWPLLRGRQSYLRTSLIVGVIWWLYHAPFVIFGWYGTVGGLPAFTISLAGFTLFVGVLTDRSRSVWPSIVAHGTWNALVATSLAASEEGTENFGLAGSDVLTGEFGWLTAATMLVVGVGAAWWHMRRSDT